MRARLCRTDTAVGTDDAATERPAESPAAPRRAVPASPEGFLGAMAQDLAGSLVRLANLPPDEIERMANAAPELEAAAMAMFERLRAARRQMGLPEVYGEVSADMLKFAARNDPRSH